MDKSLPIIMASNAERTEHQIKSYKLIKHGVLIAPLLMGNAYASGDPIYSFNLPAQPLSATLDSVAQSGHTKLIYSDATVKGLRAAPVKGKYTAQQALDIALGNSGLNYKVVDKTLITVAGKPAAESVTTLKPMTVVGEAVQSPSDPYNTSYNAANASTATKTDTPIMETPISVQVVPLQVIKDQQTVTIDQALQNVSSVYKSQAESAEAFTIRGFRSFDYYRNGVRYQSALTQAGDRETANLERIEVLKGPAAILFGRIEPGGLINLITKQPLADPYYALQQQFGSFDFYRTTLDATGPVPENDQLFYRFNLAYEDSGSFREFVNNDRIFVAPVLKWNINDRTQITFDMEYKHANESTDFGIPAVGNRPVDIPRERNLGEPWTYSESDEILAGVNWSHEFNDQWKIQHKFNATFTNEEDDVVIGSDGVEVGSTIFPRFYSGFRNNDSQSYVTSLDLTGHFDTLGLQHAVLLGGDYYHFHNTGVILADYNFPSIDIEHPIHYAFPNPDPANDYGYDTTESWYGLYLQDQIHLPYNVHLLAGFRYDNARISYDNDFAGESSITISTNDAITPRVGLLWHPLPEVSWYGNYVENFGTPNAFSHDSTGAPLSPETAQQWETGIKTELFDGRLTGTLAWYQLTKQNIAISSSDPELAFRGVSEAIGEAQNTGIELDISGEILPGWNVITSYAYIDSEITKATDGTQGNRFGGVPRNAGSLWNTYQFQTGELQGLKMGAGVVARGQQEGNNQNDFQLPGYALVNLMLGYEFKVGKSKITAQLNVDNLLDKEYFPSSTGFGRNRIDVGTPCSFLGSVKVEF